MAYTSGTATDYKDLLSILAAFWAANGSVILEQTADKVYFKATGLAGLDEIFCGIETYEDPANGRYNWLQVGSWSWRSGRALTAHPVSSCYAATAADQVVSYLWNQPIPYWLVANGRRLIVVAKVSTTYQCIHLGLLDTSANAAASQYPYPLLIGGAGSSLAANYSGGIANFWNGGHGRLSFPGGAWAAANSAGEGTSSLPYFRVASKLEAFNSSLITALDGSYLLDQMYCVASGVNRGILGKIDGLFRVSGYNNTAENIITVGGVNYLVFSDGAKSTYADYCALRLN